MLCVICNKNMAVIFTKKIDDDNAGMEGLCYTCAKEKGINPLEVLAKQANMSESDLTDMSKQFESIFEDLSENIDLDNMNMDDADGAFGSIISNMFSGSKEGANPDPSAAPGADPAKGPKIRTEKKPKEKKKSFLDIYGTNLTNKARKDEIDTVVGRDAELQRVIQILNRRLKNNPCLIGEPGVGKTAVAQGLAIAIANKKVPAKLLGKEVYLLDMTAIVAGTQFRGQFEGRMKSIIDECKQSGNIILVIDEIHNIIGAGDAEHSMNAANILKPSLSNGEVQLIGTTTLKEYKKYIEKDSALERRFQPVIIEEPSVEDTIEILKGIKKYYEDFHKVIISNDVIEKTVVMSEKYIHDRFLPDKAIDILDEACSRINLGNKELYELEVLKNRLAEIQQDKEEAALSDTIEDYQKAADLKTEECNILSKIDELNEKLVLTNITIQDIAEVIEHATKIPVKKISEAETQKLLNLESNLHNRIVGQDQAITAISKTIRRNRAGLQSTNRPPSFIFVGPTGVGKTELAKTLAFEMFGNEDALIRIDMSEYMESHSSSKMIGSPPGYVGYDDAGQLTEKVRRKPYSILLLDEIEKAHPDIFNMLLQILDDGKLTDAQGNSVSFQNTIIIMTSNAGSNLNTNSIGFGKQTMDKNKIESSLKEIFRPEFLNRVDEIVLFDSLTTEQLLEIIDLLLKSTAKALSDKEIGLEVTSVAKNFVLEKGTDLKYGARPLRRAIQKHIEDEISEMILKDEILPGQKLVVDCIGNALTFNAK
ncbi:MAG: ATP-dependent Clp protease ATP-binding subunit [Oscillospiraceae bacterium]|nr:ATP-dependent Clp protease ATP-binding subunit [Oscillospiraceae bacterium]